ncbi:tail fiber domain-containing protein [Pacificoceanicola onchidii]|uniref:tail fiber domain-containing protein n=1 Tax=Pacificoceanicola onchidii TaxID=2562685 RepID=UPI001981F067|nr:tail fiber domain-containing protein [Pacificoceanicola onchidii]
MTNHKFRIRAAVLGASALVALSASTASADQLILDDLIVDGSICVGQDCVNGESFGFDTLRLKENNLRIKAQDTSNSASFPTNDWQITFNDSSNGGQNKFSIDDIDGGRTPFTIEASAPNHSLYVDDGGRIGVGTSTPVVEIHVPNGDTPTLRLEQDGTSGFTPQTWDVAGNETNFFVRDATNGSRLPFRIRPSAPSNSLYVNTDGNIGFGTASPEAKLHVLGGSGGAYEGLRVENNGGSYVTFENNSTGRSWFFTHENAAAGRFIISRDDAPTEGMFFEADGSFRVGGDGTAAQGGMALDATGNLTIGGTLTQSSDKNAKMAIVPVDGAEVLEKVAALPLSAWTYKSEAEAGVRHMGPMAQDFRAAFGLGHNDTTISTLDTSGVALAAIQALNAQNAAQQALILELSARIEQLEESAAD